ncbi:MAG: hypothetical protein ACRCWI_06585 [Brevinema sp.]
MKQKTIKIPKKLLRLSFSSNITILSFSSFMLALLFICLSILAGVQYNIKQNITKNYNAHLSIYAPNFNLPTQKQLSSWWTSDSPTIENSTNQEYIRATTKRSSLPALFSDTPIQLTILENTDSTVFDNFMSATTSDTIIPLNHVFIGRYLANELSLSEGEPFPIYIPSLNTYCTNLTIHYIFDAPDRFSDQYQVYINKNSLSETIGIQFQKYHVRFSATPFISIVEDSIAPIIGGQKKMYTDDSLTYAYQQLNQIHRNIQHWIYFFYAFLGMLIFLIHYLSYYIIQEDFRHYLYQTGHILPFSISIQFIGLVLKKLLGISVFALGITIGFISLPIEWSSEFFISQNALYPSLNLPIMYYFTAQFPWTLLQTIPLGLVCGTLGTWILLLVFSLIPNFSNPKNKMGYIVLGMLAIVIFGFFTSHQYIHVSFAKVARNNYWAQYFFGKHMLADKDYAKYNSFQITPKTISIPQDNLKILDENLLNYMTSFESYGTASIITNTPSEGIPPLLLSKDVTVKSLQGNLIQFSNILQPLQSNQVVIGKDIADYFISNKVLNLTFEDTNATETTLVVSHIIDLPIGNFNNTIFLNHTNLTQLLKISPTEITKLQLIGSKRFLTPLTNDLISLSSLKNNTRPWNKLSDLTLGSFWIRSLFQGLLGALLVLSIILYLAIQDKNKLLLSYIWGIPYSTFSYHKIGLSFITGIFLAWFNQLIVFLWIQPLPNFLYIPLLSPRNLPFSPSWTAVPLLLIGFALPFVVLYYFFKIILRNIQKKLIQYHYRNQLS